MTHIEYRDLTKTELILYIQNLKKQYKQELNDRTLCARVLYDYIISRKEWNDAWSRRWPWIDDTDYIENFDF